VRRALFETICELAASDPRILLLTGDLGFLAVEPFRDRFPGRFFNVGVAEQNMMGIATGLAEGGFVPYAYSIAPFAALRPLEFIRNGPVLHGLPVRVAGMGAGFDYGVAGPTHHGLEDIGVLRTLPGLMVVVPADSSQAAAAIRRTAGHAGPVYYSLSRHDEMAVPGLDGQFEPGRLQVVRSGGDIAILAMGCLAAEAWAAADLLSAQGIESTVAVVSCFNPDPTRDTAELLGRFECAITVEAQTISGGLAAFVSTVIASQGIACQLHPLAVRRSPDGTSASQQESWRKHSLDRGSIEETARTMLRRGRG
jgi:transketolase